MDKKATLKSSAALPPGAGSPPSAAASAPAKPLAIALTLTEQEAGATSGR